MINLLWLVAVAVAIVFDSTRGLLAIVAVFLMEAVLELKALRVSAQKVAAVFDIEPDPLTEQRAAEISDGIMARIRMDRDVVARHAAGLR